MHDETEDIRRREQAELNAKAAERAALEAEHGQVWDTDQLRADFTVMGFQAPYVVARRTADGKVGSLQFQHNPRFYFNWKED